MKLKKTINHKERGVTMLRNLIAISAAFGGGITVGGAAAAFFTILQVVPRLVQVTETNSYIKTYQQIVITGFILFTIIYFTNFNLHLSKYTTILIGLIFGTFIGLLSSALAEVLNVIPILSKKLKIKDNLNYIIWALMAGKVAGSICFWIFIQ